MQHSSIPNPFGLGTQIFNESAEPQEEIAETSDVESEVSVSSSNESLIVAMASTTIGPSPWGTAPSYSPSYLSTTSEYLPPRPRTKLPPGAQVQDPADDEGNGKNASWAFEAYENSLRVDQVFDRFTKRVAYEGEQCVRCVPRPLYNIHSLTTGS